MADGMALLRVITNEILHCRLTNYVPTRGSRRKRLQRARGRASRYRMNSTARIRYRGLDRREMLWPQARCDRARTAVYATYAVVAYHPFDPMA